MSRTIPLQQASSQLGELVRSLGPGDEIVLTDEQNEPVARIVPSSAPVKRQAGRWKGMLTVVEDDDEHLADFKDYMP